MIRRALWLVGLVSTLCLLASGVQAERAWVKDELRLNVRTGAGTRYRIVGVLQTGDRVDILSRAEGWTQVRASRGREGWIRAGYLQPDVPARMALDRYATESVELRKQVASLMTQVEELGGGNAELSNRDANQKAEIERLTRENMELRVGARWPEWIAGALILFVGGLLGLWIRSASQRRPTPRIRM